MIRLYGHELSGNSYKARLLLSLLELDYEWMKVDLLAGAHKKPEFLALNPLVQHGGNTDTILAPSDSPRPNPMVTGLMPSSTSENQLAGIPDSKRS